MKQSQFLRSINVEFIALARRQIKGCDYKVEIFFKTSRKIYPLDQVDGKSGKFKDHWQKPFSCEKKIKQTDFDTYKEIE